MITTTERSGEIPAFLKMLEAAAHELKNGRSFTAELSEGELRQMVFQIVEQSKEEMKKNGVTAQIGNLEVKIDNGKGEVNTAVAASKKVLFTDLKADITAQFGLENVLGPDNHPTGKLKTSHLEVSPETLFKIIKPKDFLAPYVEGDKINDTFMEVLDEEMQQRNARISKGGLHLEFTSENTLRIVVNGGPK